MPKPEIIYQRGRYQLRRDITKDGRLRSPNLAIFWYDAERRRERSATTGTADVRLARKALDRRYLTSDEGEHVCPTCGQSTETRSPFLADAIADYLAVKDDNTLNIRLRHVVDYLATLSGAVRCDQVNEKWVERFRRWSVKQPVVFTSGKVRSEPRAASTTENSLIQLAAAIRAARQEPRFRPIPTKDINNTPRRRLSIDEMARAFRYALEPKLKRDSLLRFLCASVATTARPDAAHEISTDPRRKQWDSDSRTLSLNPHGRRQTKKYRATVKAPYQFALLLDKTKGPFVPVGSVRKAHDAMCKDLGWPKDRENGLKLWRRSVAQLLRDPARGVPTEQIELLLGHRKMDSVTDLYAAFDPAYLREATAALEAIIDEIEALVPGAYHRSDTGEASNIVPIKASVNA